MKGQLVVMTTGLALLGVLATNVTFMAEHKAYAAVGSPGVGTNGGAGAGARISTIIDGTGAGGPGAGGLVVNFCSTGAGGPDVGLTGNVQNILKF